MKSIKAPYGAFFLSMQQSLVVQLFDDGKYGECIKIFSTADYSDLNLAELKLIAKSYLLTANYQKSIEIYHKLLADGNQEIEVYCNLARSYLSIGDIASSLIYYHLLEKISPNFPPMCRGLAISYSQQGDYDNSIKYAKKFDEYFNGDTYTVADTYYQVYLSFGDIKNANSLINSLGFLQVDPRFLLLRVKAYVKNNNFNDALIELGNVSGWKEFGEELINIGLHCLLATTDTKSILLSVNTIPHSSILPNTRLSIVKYLYMNSEIDNLKNFLRLTLAYKCISPTYYLYSAAIMLDMDILDLAESLGRESFNQDSSNPVCSLHLSIVYGEQSKYNEALKYALLSNKLDPHMAESKLELANIYAKSGEHGKACLYCLELIVEKKLTQKAFSNLISILEREELYTAALSVLNLDICDIVPHAKSLQLANLLRKANDSEQALIFAKEAIELNPENGKAWSTYSAILWDLGNEKEALNACSKALSYGDSIDPLNNSASINIDLGRYTEALSNIEKVLEMNPTHSNCNFLKSSIKLMELDFNKGWHHYSFRTKMFPEHVANVPLYTGQLSGKLLVLSEQGIGDEITFAQCYFNLLQSNSLIVDIECDSRLCSLFSSSFNSSDKRLRFIDRGSHESGCYDYYIFAGDLMRLFRSHIDDFKITSNGYLKTDSRVFVSLDSLGGSNKKLVGLSWKTKLKRHMNRKNCVDLVKMLAPLRGKEDLTYVCLQYGEVLDDIEMVRKTLGISILTVEDLDLYNDINGLASLINRCDVVYTTPNVTVGLSGAIGKETHFLLPSGGPRWRWGLSNGSSYMFNKVYIHRQDHLTGDWDQAIESACSMLV